MGSLADEVAALVAAPTGADAVPPEHVPELLGALERARAALWGRLLGPAVGRVRVGELLNDLETEYRIQGRAALRTLRGQVGALKPLVGHLRAVDVSTALLRRVVERWQVDGAAPATINKRMTTL